MCETEEQITFVKKIIKYCVYVYISEDFLNAYMTL